MINAIDANMYLYLFVENIAPIQEIDTANCIHFKLNSVVLNIGKSSVSCPLKPSDSAPLKHSTMPP